MVVVALGEPGVPVVCWALTGKAASRKNRDAAANLSRPRFLGSSFGAFIGVFCRLSVERCKTEISGRRNTSLKLGMRVTQLVFGRIRLSNRRGDARDADRASLRNLKRPKWQKQT